MRVCERTGGSGELCVFVCVPDHFNSCVRRKRTLSRTQAKRTTSQQKIYIIASESRSGQVVYKRGVSVFVFLFVFEFVFVFVYLCVFAPHRS